MPQSFRKSYNKASILYSFSFLSSELGASLSSESLGFVPRYLFKEDMFKEFMKLSYKWPVYLSSAFDSLLLKRKEWG